MTLDWIDLIANIGFPIAVAVFVLLRLEKSMGKVEDALMKMTETLIRIDEFHSYRNDR